MKTILQCRHAMSGITIREGGRPTFKVKWYKDAESEMLNYLEEHGGNLDFWNALSPDEKEKYLTEGFDLAQNGFVDRVENQCEALYEKYARKNHPRGAPYRGQKGALEFAHHGRSGGWLVTYGLSTLQDIQEMLDRAEDELRMCVEEGDSGPIDDAYEAHYSARYHVSAWLAMLNEVEKVIKREMDDVGYQIAFHICNNTDFLTDEAEKVQKLMLNGIPEKYVVSDEVIMEIHDIARRIVDEAKPKNRTTVCHDCGKALQLKTPQTDNLTCHNRTCNRYMQ
jgi:hypothetical protein